MNLTDTTNVLKKIARPARSGASLKATHLLAIAALLAFLVPAHAQDAALLAKAQAGDAAAENSVGDFYYAKNTPQDYNQSAAWYLKAADQGYPKAQYSLGISYCWHEGVPEDYTQAYVWLDLAIKGQVEDTNHWLNYAASHMTPAEIAQGQKLAQQWLKSHTEKPAL